jgi:hypothetical protein
VVGVSNHQATGSPLRHETAAECRGCGEITELIQGSDWCWTCVYTDPPYVDYAGRPTLAGNDPGGPPRDR